MKKAVFHLKFIWLIYLFVAGLSVSSAEDNDLKKALRELSWNDEKLATLSADQLTEKAVWILQEFKTWRANNPADPEPDLPDPGELEPAPDPFFSNEDPFSDSDKETPLSSFDFFFSLKDILEVLLLNYPDDFTERLIGLANRFPEFRNEEYHSDILNNYLLASRIVESISNSPVTSLQNAINPDEEIPAFLSEASSGIIQAWREARLIKKTVNLQSNQKGGIPYHANHDSFSEILSECLIENRWTRSDTISKMTWDASCGHGIDNFRWPKTNFGAVDFINKGKHETGLSLFLHSWISGPYVPVLSFDLDSEKWDSLIARKLNQANFDWERPACGMLLIDPRWPQTMRMSKHGGETTARLLAEISKLPDSPLLDWSATLEILTQLYQRHLYGDRNSLDPFQPETGANPRSLLSTETEKAALAAIYRLLKKAEEPQTIISAMEMLLKHSPDRSKEKLKQLVSNPVPSVSRRALYLLKKSGIPMKELGDPAGTEDYNLTFQMNGTPLSNLKVSIQQPLVSRDRKSYSISGGFGDPVQFDTSGKISFTRSDRLHISDTRACFSCFPVSSKGRFSPIAATEETPMFAFLENFKMLKSRQTGIIEIPALQLQLDIQYPERRISKTEPHTTILAISQQPFTNGLPDILRNYTTARYRLETTKKSVQFTNAGPGYYYIKAWIPGCAAFDMQEPVELNKNQTVQLTPAPGYQLAIPERFYDRKKFGLELIRKSEKQDTRIPVIDTFHQIENWNHLEAGNYELHVWDNKIPSSKSRKIPFVILHESPGIITLEKELTDIFPE